MNKLIKATTETSEEYIQYNQDHKHKHRKRESGEEGEGGRERIHRWNLGNIDPQPYEVSNEVDSLYSSLLLTCALSAMSSIGFMYIARIPFELVTTE